MPALKDMVCVSRPPLPVQKGKEHEKSNSSVLAAGVCDRVDLRLRGPGEFFGIRQSGLPEFRIANLIEDGDLISLARKEAFGLVDRDPQLRSIAHHSLRRHFEECYKDAFALGSVG